jgi:hypothetical protein
MKQRLPHRGSNGDLAAFAQDFIQKRTQSLRKDISICLTDTPTADGKSVTHAYFPALAACCAFMEYMTGLHRGRLAKIGWDSVDVWAEKYMDRTHYTRDTVRVLFDGFRHSVAHRGIATGIWLDRHLTGAPARRITWRLDEDAERPSCRLAEDVGELTRDPPWPCPHTHRMHIHLAALAEDLCVAAERYASDIAQDKGLLTSFERAMQTLYPVEKVTQ